MATTLFLRNIKTGEIKELEPFSDEHVKIRLDRTDDDRRYVWEATSSADADPEQYAHPDEVAARRRWGVTPLSFVKADGTPTSEAAAEALANVDPGNRGVGAVERDKPSSSTAAKKPQRKTHESRDAGSDG